MPEPTTHRDDWETIASLDPYWAVLSEPAGKHGGWDEDEFFATGEREVAERLAVAAGLGLPHEHGTVLDFGCGLGRTARPLARRFDRSVGLDISETMLIRARELHGDVGNLEWVRADGSEPLAFEDAAFDAVYSNIALQHLPGEEAVVGALRELARVTAPAGLLCFQLPTALVGLGLLQPRSRAYVALRAVGVPGPVLYGRLGLHPIRMLAVAREQVATILAGSGVELVRVVEDRSPRHGIVSAVYYARKR